MKRLIFPILTLLGSLGAVAQQTQAPAPTTFAKDVNIIPEPASLVRTEGMFKLPKHLNISAPRNQQVDFIVQEMCDRLHRSAGTTHSKSTAPSKATNIEFRLSPSAAASLKRDGYILDVKPGKVTIEAAEPNGLFYGMQSFLQLLPPQADALTLQPNTNWQAPCVHITDVPKTEWRGLHFDVARHFFTKAEVKHYIDDMVKYKYNILHWHLSDDEGWRIEIKSLPKLTSVGAWRVPRTGRFNTFKGAQPGEAATYGGFYTQDDIREVVAYAKERFVNILPEIDMPAHSLAAVVSYPELSCTPGADKYTVRAGEPIANWTSKGPIGYFDNTLCPANEKVYAFADSVVREMSALFPFPYFHIGGDEAAYNLWENKPAIADLMKRENLKTMQAVQGYFTRRLEKIVNSYGKQMMGWDEILEGDINPTTAIMSWRGVAGGVKASQSGHKVIMAPNKNAYLDLMQGDPTTDPTIYDRVLLNAAYNFQLYPAGSNPANIIGGQATLWTENIYNFRQVQYMLWPRAMAVAEKLWSPDSKTSWPHFITKIEGQFPRFDFAQTKYSPAMYDPVVYGRTQGKDLMVYMQSQLDGLDLYYSFDYSEPDNFYPKYTGPVAVPTGATMVKVISYRNGKPVGRMLRIPVETLTNRKAMN